MTREKPLIIFDYGDEKNRTRGDCQGVLGVARTVTALLDGDIAITDRSEPLSRETPDLLFMPHNLSRAYDITKVTFSFCGMNENLSMRYTGDTDIVPNLLTPDILEKQGAEFRERFPDLPRPLIALNIADLFNHKSFFGALSQLLDQYQTATLFMTGCWRTPRFNYLELRDALSGHDAVLSRPSGQGRIKFLDFELADRENKGKFNPYTGLLHCADHVIVAGTSLSMISESLAAGKIPYVAFEHFYGPELSRLARKNLVCDFNGAAAACPLETTRIVPINRTFECARKIADEYLKRKAGRSQALAPSPSH